ncbi:hypothetical protein GCM10009824_01430 [Kocuria atrinae]|uniref:Uncharacterized protein n=1 Tax=Kocuria atrinae TaxID=592377 RepID=A0ABN2XAI1_9MICC
MFLSVDRTGPLQADHDFHGLRTAFVSVSIRARHAPCGIVREAPCGVVLVECACRADAKVLGNYRMTAVDRQVTGAAHVRQWSL